MLSRTMSELNPTYDQPLVRARSRSASGILARGAGRLPKSILVTAAVTLATAWLFPALSHQWQDRQKAKELTAALVSQIGSRTSEALVTSSFLTYNCFPASEHTSKFGFNQDVYNKLDLGWRTSSAEIEAQLQAYYPERVVDEWREYSDLVWGTYRLITNNMNSRPGTVRRLRELFHGIVPGWYIDKMEQPWVDRPDADARKAYFAVSQAVLGRRTVVMDEMLSSRPAGFSTRPGDLLRDLVPGI
jgi:hypothetical protein